MSDLISRQAAIDAVCMEWCGVKHKDCKHPFDVEKDDYYWCDGCETALRTLPDLPSAEPEKVLIAKITLSEEQVREAVEKAKSESIQLLPSVQPRPRGRWIPVDSYSAFGGDEATWMAHGNPVAFYYCSECKEQAYAGEDGESLLTDFCPSCGADMREEEQDE